MQTVIYRMDKQQGSDIYLCVCIYIYIERTGNCIQYSVINHNGKEYEKIYIFNWMGASQVVLVLIEPGCQYSRHK